jgi:hypothetical protein
MALDFDEGIKTDQGFIVAVYGPAKIGKTTFAARSSQRPMFIAAEGGSDNVDVRRVKFDATGRTKPNTWEEFLAKLNEISNAPELPAGSLVIDGLGAIENLCVDHVVKNAPSDKGGRKPQSLTEIGGGFSRGERALYDEFRRIVPPIDALKARGIHTIMTLHAKFDKAVSVTGAEDAKRIAPALVGVKDADLSGWLVQWADAVLYADIDSTLATVEDGFKKKKTWGIRVGDTHVLHTRKEPGLLTGCRYGSIPHKLPLDWDVFHAEIVAARSCGDMRKTADDLAVGLNPERRVVYDQFKAGPGWYDITQLNKVVGWMRSLEAPPQQPEAA